MSKDEIKKDVKSRLWNDRYGRVCFKTLIAGEEKVVLNIEDVSDYADAMFDAGARSERERPIPYKGEKLSGRDILIWNAAQKDVFAQVAPCGKDFGLHGESGYLMPVICGKSHIAADGSIFLCDYCKGRAAERTIKQKTYDEQTPAEAMKVLLDRCEEAKLEGSLEAATQIIWMIEKELKDTRDATRGDKAGTFQLEHLPIEAQAEYASLGLLIIDIKSTFGLLDEPVEKRFSRLLKDSRSSGIGGQVDSAGSDGTVNRVKVRQADVDSASHRPNLQVDTWQDGRDKAVFRPFSLDGCGETIQLKSGEKVGCGEVDFADKPILCPSCVKMSVNNTFPPPKGGDDSRKVSRVELIDDLKGMRYSRWDCEVELSYQDDGRTLKIFVKEAQR